MKKTYVTPEAEKIEFDYQEQVVAASSETCDSRWVNVGQYDCEDGIKHLEYLK